MSIDPSKLLLVPIISAGVWIPIHLGYELFATKSIFENLVNSSKTPLDTEGQKDDKLWEKLVNNYEKEGNEKISGFDLIGSIFDENHKNKKIKLLKEKCKNIYKEKYNLNSDVNWKNVNNWCIKESSRNKY